MRGLLEASNLRPGTVCEIGCGAGGVLAELRRSYPRAELFGYDVASDAARFWPEHEHANIRFRVGDFFVLNNRTYDLVLLLDVIEHLVNPFAFLSDLRGTASYYVLHVPLDLSALTVLRERPLMDLREQVGHIHYFTKDLALSLLRECGYDIVRWGYSGATFTSPQRTWKTKLASGLRRSVYALNKDWGVRALGGETLVVLAQDRR